MKLAPEFPWLQVAIRLDVPGANFQNEEYQLQTSEKGFPGVTGKEGGMNKVRSPGQALIEYALILVLVSLVVIVILGLLGPSVGGVFSNAVNAVSTPGAGVHPTPTAGPPPAGGWVFCSHEYHDCNFTGTHNVRYGLNNHYYYRVLTGGTYCGNGIFGDPWVGYEKECHYWDPNIP